MHSLDLNLLQALDVLLEEGSVVAAAARVHLSPPAMSRTLSRIREMVGDPVLVRAGSRLVPTPRAEELRPQVRALLEEARRMLVPTATDFTQLSRVFTLRATDATAATIGPRLAERIRAEAPNVTLQFVTHGEDTVDILRDGEVDLEIGVLGDVAPEIRSETLYVEHLVGVVRADHPMLAGSITAQQFAAAGHISFTRRGRTPGPVDAALAQLGLTRSIALAVQHANAALLAAANSDLVAVVGDDLARRAERLRLAISVFNLPFDTPEIPIAFAWHRRMDTDPAHRWLRDHVKAVTAVPSGMNGTAATSLSRLETHATAH